MYICCFYLFQVEGGELEENSLWFIFGVKSPLQSDSYREASTVTQSVLLEEEFPSSSSGMSLLAAQQPQRETQDSGLSL